MSLFSQAPIPRIPFKAPKEPFLDLEVMTLSTLFLRMAQARLTLRPHRVDFFITILITQGCGLISVDFKSQRFVPGSWIFIHPAQVFHFQHFEGCEGILVLFKEGFVNTDLEIFDDWSPSFVISGAGGAGESLEQGILDLQKEYGTGPQDLYRAEVLRSLLTAVLLRAERQKRALHPRPGIRGSEDFLRFKRSVDLGFPRTRGVSDYGRELGLSPKKLNTLTQNHFGCGAKDFIDQRVLREIKRLLAHTDLGLKEIAQACGFDEVTNLVKFFKRLEGLTPEKFRGSLDRIS